jgi:LysM repeat protein
MSKKVTITIAIAIIAVALFSACERSASNTKKATPTAKGSQNTPQSTNILLLQSWETVTANYVQTAVAQGTFTAAPANQTPQSTPTPTQLGAVAATATPTSLVPATGFPTNTVVAGATPVVIVPTATPGRPVTYTLQKGEFPYCLARRFDVDPNQLLSMNGLINGQNLQPGLVLSIPQSGSFPSVRALHAHPAQFTVNVDDTFYSIACYFGDIDPSSIAAANGLSLTSPLTTGQILNIP